MDRAIHLPPTLGFAPRRLEEGEFSPDLVKTTYLYGRAMQSSPILKTLRTNVPVRYTTYNRSWSNVYIGMQTVYD
ncbi:hypothetical protein M3591_03065 [Exiguobacterium sp. MER 193]|uniref:hypothetical protein n=1 Tax=Exiguobacterium sp. MER 193 TaxID=2939564 RepID=UPI00203DC042|nr:hypothetical protein [Exiguobacterium sp. MER 193]MCM3279514.1 hypothetical protein [Exiguobacterium sp. MER 193]